VIYWKPKKRNYCKIFIVLSFLNTFNAKTPDSSATQTFIVNAVPKLSDSELITSDAAVRIIIKVLGIGKDTSFDIWLTNTLF
jgi:hypothetical protein